MTTSLFVPAPAASTTRSIEVEMRAHGLRVGSLAHRIAEALGTSPAGCHRLAAAAVPHDFGKTTIPAEILLQPGPLDEAQREIVRGHSVAGERIARRFPGEYGILAAAIARSHHERFDGHGYPDGLAGDAIPLAVAIVTVADVFDALTSDRPYRPAFSRREALEMMRRERGGQFAPTVLDAFLRVVGQVEAPAPPQIESVAAQATGRSAPSFRYRRPDRRPSLVS